MRTLKESILDKDFDISESDEIRMLIEQIVGLGKWECWNSVARIVSPSSQQIFDKILGIVQTIIRNYKSSSQAKVEVFYDRRRSIMHIIEKAKRYEGVEGIRISVSSPFGKDTVAIYYSATFDYDSVTSESGLKKIGTVSLDVIKEMKNKLQLNS